MESIFFSLFSQVQYESIILIKIMPQAQEIWRGRVFRWGRRRGVLMASLLLRALRSPPPGSSLCPGLRVASLEAEAQTRRRAEVRTPPAASSYRLLGAWELRGRGGTVGPGAPGPSATSSDRPGPRQQPRPPPLPGRGALEEEAGAPGAAPATLGAFTEGKLPFAQASICSQRNRSRPGTPAQPALYLGW